MRLFPIVAAGGLAVAMVASSVNGQAPDNQINPQSVAAVRVGEAAIAAGNFEAADDAFETALAIDPRNRAAFLALARVAQRQKLYAQAVRLTNRALALEPNDVNALSIQGEAMVEMGAVARARQNLDKVRKLCGANGCAQAATLAAAIQRGQSMAASTATPRPKAN